MLAPPRVWWKPLGRLEKTWLYIALAWCVFLTAMMPIWFIYGKQNVPVESYRTTPEQHQKATEAFAKKYQVGEETSLKIPVVAPPPGDIYMYGKTWSWYPILKLKKGQTYRLHLSSLDLQHGFSLQPSNLNFMVLPHYDYVITLTPSSSGTYSVVCNEYCFVGHHLMVGKIVVED
jgi:cytochrome c oxidase subunit 2